MLKSFEEQDGMFNFLSFSYVQSEDSILILSKEENSLSQRPLSYYFYMFGGDLRERIMPFANGLFHRFFFPTLNCADLQKMLSPLLLPSNMSFVNVHNCQHAYSVIRGSHLGSGLL